MGLQYSTRQGETATVKRSDASSGSTALEQAGAFFVRPMTSEESGNGSPVA